VVVGGGIAGLTTAVRLREAGAQVVLLERHRVGAGVTGGSTAKLTALHGTLHARIRRQHGPEATAVYAAANAAAVTHVESLVDRHGIDCDLVRAEAVNYATTPAGLSRLRDDLEAARDAGLPVEERSGTELPFPVLGAVALADQAHLHPVRLCEGLAAALAPGTVHEGTAVVEVDEDSAGCHARTAGGATVHAAHAVIATQGPIVDPRYLSVRCRPVRSYVVAAELDGPVPEGMYLAVDEATRSVRPATAGGRRYLLVGGEGHPVADEEDARVPLDTLESWARAAFAVRAVGPRWAAHDLEPSDHLPFAGRLTPGSRRWVATGFRKWGFTTAAVAASIVADGIAGADHPAARLLDPARLRSTFTPELARDVARVASRYVGDEVTVRLRRRRSPEEAARLDPGSAVVVDTGAGPTAVHRDDAGRLHAVSATCTHEGCLVRFNAAQRTWDCPCHGSRFAPDGTVLAGPAVDDLPPVDLG
jgi:glycine/D-amino acid oxidase-like deaminating enzyme/nitrite reductase/ring-hydroxylating ferredoxin subunit